MATLPFDPFNQDKLREEAKHDTAQALAQKKAQDEADKRRKKTNLESKKASLVRDLERVTRQKDDLERSKKTVDQKSEVHGSELETLEKEEIKTERELASLERTYKEKESLLADIKRKVATFLSRFQQKKSGADSISESLKQTEGKKSTLEHSDESLTVKEREEVRSIQEKKDQIKRLEQELRTLENQFTRTHDERLKVENELKNLSVAKSRDASKAQQETRETNALVSEKEKLEHEAKLKEEELAQFEIKIKTQEKEIEQFKTKIQTLKRGTGVFVQQERNAEGRLREVETEIKRITSQVAEIDREIMSLR